ncbi:hypothetical protein Tco_0378919 [Tanacetum coccineum]
MMIPVRPPFLPPCVAAVAWPALRVIILGGIIYTKEDIGPNVGQPPICGTILLNTPSRDTFITNVEPRIIYPILS